MQAILENNNVKAKGMSEAEISSTFHLVLVAGLETLSSTITAMTYLLLKNPAALRKVIDKVRQAFKREEDITLFRSTRLPYVMGAINEGMYMIPPTP